MNLQQIIAVYKQETGKDASSKKGKFTGSFEKFNRKLLREGRTNTYYDKTKYYSHATDRLRKHKLGANNLPTQASLQTAKNLHQEFLKKSKKYVYDPEDKEVVKISTLEQIKNPIPYLEQEFGLKNITNIQELKNEGFELLSEIPPNLKIKGTLKISFMLYYNDKPEKPIAFAVNAFITPNELTNEYINNLIETNWGPLDMPLSARDKKVEVATSKTSTLKAENMKMFDSAPLKIHSLFNETIDSYGPQDCVKSHIDRLWGKRLSNKQKEILDNIRTTEDLACFCEKYKIKMLAYDITGKLIKSVIPKKTTKNFANLVYVAYNNHLYPLKNAVLKKTYVEKLKLCHNAPGKTHFQFKEFLKAGILPKLVSVHQKTNKITAFILDNEINFENEDFKKCERILEKFGMQDRLTWYTRLTNVANILQSAYIKESVDSFWPDHSKYRKKGFTYRGPHDYNELCSEEYITCDKNKAFSYELMSLEHLISVDFKTAIWKKLEGIVEDITPHYIYLVSVEKSNIFFDTTNIFTGEHILKAIKYGLVQGENFSIDEYVETEKHPNYFKKMIEDIYEKINEKDAKKIVNAFIGRFESTSNVKYTNTPLKICNLDEAKTHEGELVQLTPNYWIAMELQPRANVTNRKPIAIQVKDACRFRMFQFCMDNNIKNEDVAQIKTDSITFKKRNDKYKNFIKPGIKNWKVESFKDIIKSYPKNDEKLTMNFENVNKEQLVNKMVYKNNSLVQGLAGNGKTTFINKTLIPRIEEDQQKYIVLTPSHDAAMDYRLNKRKISVIQKYQHQLLGPDIDHIIIDEIGMVGSKDWEIIIKCKMLGKYIYAFGDFNQLPPVKSKKVTKNFLNSIFESWVWFKHNYRNKFTIAYYKRLINYQGTKWLREQVRNVSEDVWEEDTMLICYTNATRHKHNKICCEKMGVPYEINEKQEIFVHPDVPAGVPVICKTNALSMLGIYNKFSFKTKGKVWKHPDKEKKEDPYLNIVIENKIGKEYCLRYETLRKYFEYAYCRTAYSVQGKTIPKIKFCEEDINFLSNETAYTIISRKYEEKDNSNIEPYQLLEKEI